MFCYLWGHRHYVLALFSQAKVLADYILGGFTRPSYKGKAAILIPFTSAWRNVPNVKTEPLLQNFGTCGMMLTRPMVLRAELNYLFWQPMTSHTHTHNWEWCWKLIIKYLTMSLGCFSVLYRSQNSSSLKKIVSLTDSGKVSSPILRPTLLLSPSLVDCKCQRAG